MPAVKQPITVSKRNTSGKETWRYSGTLLFNDGRKLVLEARFNRPDEPFMGTMLKEGDRFVETYYTDRWYNIYEIHDKEDDRIKGWYCNVARPAVLERADLLAFVDLALDLWVSPEGEQTVLDEDEFEALHLDEATQEKARAALEELKEKFRDKQRPGL